ncbi:glycoside hydrolase family 95 protein [Aspergillus stella-maris]|uniref:glycoside hydrolase family 95 protein n=1 Tax=Aspergillus stella-maris TaxID=1810926 RepID=UPI003CCE0103
MRITIAFFAAISNLCGIAAGKTLRSSSPATYTSEDGDDNILRTGYLIGNGKLGAIPFGPPGDERINLNIDSLWSGGPFEIENYTGGNPSSPIYDALPGIRDIIFQDGTGDMDELLGSGDNYGSNRVLGNLTVTFDGADTYTSYGRTLDLSEGVHRTEFSLNNGNGSVTLETSIFCSYPDQVCVYHFESNKRLPTLTVNIENLLVDQGLLGSTCEGSKGVLRHSGVTQIGPPEGMKYAAVARVDPSSAKTTCSSDGKLQISSSAKEITIVISAETNYDQKAGNSENGWSFKGADPAPIVERTSASAVAKGFEKLLNRHTEDYQSLSGSFSLDLPDPSNSAGEDTADLIEGYSYNSTGNPFLENLLFDYGRHLLISSSRANSLPANLQGRWTELLTAAWSADYHANINLQMNYWPADQTGLAETQSALWNYMADTWVPRGSETAKLIYNASGWVVHNEMNVFGYTAMKESAGWANYPAAAAWMMQHVWDAFEYTQDKAWLESQGYPLLKDVASFWLTSLQEDKFFNDSSLVVNPCNSPETGPTTFGCAHYQQLIHQVFESVLAAQEFISNDETDYISAIKATLKKLDKGFHISSWGGVKEWKLPDSYGYDGPSTHRHLSHLVGWYPGYSLSSYLKGYINETIQDAVRETLISRGDGNAEDANAGWAKVWRSACWARLNDSVNAYDLLRYAIDENFVGNGLSMYSGTSLPFQIDANFGFTGAVLSMLVYDVPMPFGTDVVRTVVLGPAIPAEWAGGSVKGLRLRGGAIVDFSWDDGGVVDRVTIVAGARDGREVRLVNVAGEVLAEL